jgi:hypothetical protein
MQSDEMFYEAVVSEIEGGGVRKGLWAKAFARAAGVEHIAKALYIEWRVDQLKSDMAAEMAARAASAEEAARRQAEFDAEQERVRAETELNMRSEAQYPAFLALARRFLRSGMSQEVVEYQLKIRGLARESAARAVREAARS